MNRIVGISILLSTLIVGCDQSRIFDKYKSIENHDWYYKDTVNFKVEITDTTSKYNLFLNIRNKAGYPYRNIWLNTTTVAPNGAQNQLKNEFKLANKKGKWHGQGLGDVYDHRYIVREGFRVNQKGKYHFKITHLMRQDTLPGIMDVGLRIEKVR